MALDQPLSNAELDELDDFLASEAIEDRSMDVSTLEGFLTAIAIGPNTLRPSEWLPWVWDMKQGEAEAEFESAEQAKRIMALVLRYYNAVIHAFTTDPASFEPIFRRGAQWGAAEWSEGFLLGTRVARDAWGLLWAGRPELATPFLRLGTGEGIELTRKAGDAKRWLEAVEPALVEMYAFWKARRADRPPGQSADDFRFGRQPRPLTRDAPKVGRNDPCPCGSGKKFKKCCGADGVPPVMH